MTANIRSLLTLSALTLCSLAAHAQSTVTIYGVMDAGLVYESGGPGGSVKKLTPGVASGSRLGFRGTEDLGDGLSAFFVLEQGLLNDVGALAQGGLAFGRQALVGVAGAFGKVSLGRQYTPAAMVQVEMDPFTTGLAGTSANLLSPGGAGGSNRMNNTVKYNAPGGLGGFNAEMVYAFGEQAASSAGREYGFSVGYADGPLSVKMAQHQVTSATLVTGKVSWLAGRYTVGVLTAYLNLVVNKGSRVFGVLNQDAQDVLVGVAAPVGQGKLMASYIKKNDKTAANADADQVAFGYDHFLSKRTDLYVSFARINSRAPIVAGVSGFRVGNATEQGSGNKAITVGARHAF